MYQRLLFDLDGTLTDSAPGIWSSLQVALQEVGLPPALSALQRQFIGPPLHDSLRNLLGVPEALVEPTYRAYRAEYTANGWSNNSPFEGMANLVADAAACGRRVAVATSKPEHTAIRILDHFNLSQHFEFIAGATEDGSRRTKAAVVQRALQALNFDASMASETILVGDREHDVAGAAVHGIDSVLVSWGYGVEAERAEATHQVDSVSELRRLLSL